MIMFGEKDMRYDPPRHDKPMVISVVVAEYKVERVLIDQGSSANILYWSTYMKMGLYGFAGEQVEIRGAVELETTFGEGNHARSTLVLYTVVDVEASYNIIMGRPTLNKLGAVVSTYHLCMKYPIGQDIGRANKSDVNILDLDLDPRCDDERKRPLPTKDLKEVNIGLNPTHKTKIGTALAQEEESHLISFLQENWDVFAWSLADMLGIDPDFICHHLSISPSFRSVA
ncbi:hypothetical protein CR513_33434, partial [Mucuna pruriens]